jgi:hypothetical protein
MLFMSNPFLERLSRSSMFADIPLAMFDNVAAN